MNRSVSCCSARFFSLALCFCCRRRPLIKWTNSNDSERSAFLAIRSVHSPCCCHWLTARIKTRPIRWPSRFPLRRTCCICLWMDAKHIRFNWIKNELKWREGRSAHKISYSTVRIKRSGAKCRALSLATCCEASKILFNGQRHMNGAENRNQRTTRMLWKCKKITTIIVGTFNSIRREHTHTAHTNTAGSR